MQAFWDWWQHLPEGIDPVIFQIGWFRLQYYGLMYLVAFAVCYGLVRYRIRTENRFDLSVEQAGDLMLNMILGLVVGARLGYVLFYNPSYFLRYPWEIVLPFDISNGFTFTGISGMSYHGGLLGVLAAAGYTVKSRRLDFWQVGDLFAPAAPLGYTFGRIGNFINGELYGRRTDAPIGMFFPQAPGIDRRHPSQLYEAFFEGIVLFVLLWMLRKFSLPRGAMLPIYLIGYGTVRFFIEYFRQPDAHLGLVLFSFSMGQVLCALMIGAGALLLANRIRADRGGRNPVQP
ncbi:MAG: prolipoprotein diacylglyceryl transferase [Desulfobacteraceae bacterium]|nr:prolipoprotein diacylglyceryl transferase [Desulfobacteraceae bacterium]